MFGEEDERWERLDPVDALHASVSLTILANLGNQLQVMMQDNHEGPYSGKFVLPHQILRDDQTIEEVAKELCAAYDLDGTELEQVGAFSFPRIDPRSRVMTVGFAGAVPRHQLGSLLSRNDLAMVDITMERGVALLSHGGLPVPTGFMHDEVVAEAVEKLRKAADYSLQPFSMVPEAFTYAELHAAHEAIQGRTITMQWLRKKLNKRVFEGDRMIVGTGVLRRDGPCKPAELYELIYVDPYERRVRQQSAAAKAKLAARRFQR
jgi:8-oxo-dGTP diphosphatase